MVEDNASQQSGTGNPMNAPPANMVESGNLILHLVRLTPAAPERIDMDELTERQFDPSVMTGQAGGENAM